MSMANPEAITVRYKPLMAIGLSCMYGKIGIRCSILPP